MEVQPLLSFGLKHSCALGDSRALQIYHHIVTRQGLPILKSDLNEFEYSQILIRIDGSSNSRFRLPS